jgi:hypothetical protein
LRGEDQEFEVSLGYKDLFQNKNKILVIMYDYGINFKYSKNIDISFQKESLKLMKTPTNGAFLSLKNTNLGRHYINLKLIFM